LACEYPIHFFFFAFLVEVIGGRPQEVDSTVQISSEVA